MKKIEVKKEDLIYQFVDLNKTISECSKIFGVCDKTIRKKIIEMNIQKDSLQKKMIGKKFGRWLVLNANESNKKLTCKCECGVEKEVSSSALRSGRSKSCGCYHKEVMALCLHSKSNVNNILSKEQLEEEYLNRRKTDKNIGDKYGFHEETIRRYRKKLGIDKYVISTVNELLLNEEQKEIIDGTIMGDGHFNSSGQLEITHSDKQYSYIYWLNYKLSSISTGLIPNKKSQYRFRTKALDYIKNLHKSLYKNKAKTVNLDFLNNLTPLGLSIWFCDDAYLDNGSNYVLCTQGFSSLDRDLICQYFMEKWDIKCGIKKINSKKYSKTYEANYFDHENSTKLTNIIKYHIIPSMLYKLLKSEKKHVVYLAGGMQASPDGGVKWRRNVKQMLNQKGYYCIDPTKEENCLNLDDNWRESISTDFKLFQKNMRVIIDNDLYFVRNSHHIVCLYDDFLGGGSFHEIGESYLQGKNLYILNLNKKPISKLNWWALGCCTKVVETYEELMECFEDLSNKMYVPYLKRGSKI
jgi:hypothetical protein